MAPIRQRAGKVRLHTQNAMLGKRLQNRNPIVFLCNTFNIKSCAVEATAETHEEGSSLCSLLVTTLENVHDCINTLNDFIMFNIVPRFPQISC